MREVRVTEAKARLAELLRVVEYGETVVITRHGKAIAQLVPACRQERISHEEAVARFRAWRRRRRRIEMSTEEILAALHEGHRW